MTRDEAFDLYTKATDAASAQIAGAVDGGSCGQSAVLIRDARQPFVRHLRAAGIGSAGYPGWIVSPDLPQAIQSLNVHETAARAMAGVLESAGIRAHVKIWPD